MHGIGRGSSIDGFWGYVSATSGSAISVTGYLMLSRIHLIPYFDCI